MRVSTKMTSPAANELKRVNADGSVSPPPSKRRQQSTTTSVSAVLDDRTLSNGKTGKAVANFFAPARKKDLEKISWRIVNKSLLVGRYQALATGAATGSNTKRRKIAAFDLV